MERQLTHYEIELLDVLWKRGEGTVQDVCNDLDRDLAYTTVMTTLNILTQKKGVLQRIKTGRAFVYRPLVTREEVSRSVLGRLRDVLFADELPSLVLHLIGEHGLSADDAATIRAALDQLEGDT